MATIFIIDDEGAAELLTDALGYPGHQAKLIRSIQEALINIDDLSDRPCRSQTYLGSTAAYVITNCVSWGERGE